MVNGQDTGHRITGNAYAALKEYHGPRCSGYDDKDYSRFFFTELLTLAPFGLEADQHGRYLTTDFDFRVVDYRAAGHDQLWYVPNEIHGITMMKPEDY